MATARSAHFELKTLFRNLEEHDLKVSFNDAVLCSFETSTTKVDEYMAKYLKYAPERMGGSGRKK